MKFVVMSVWDVSKAAELAKISDKVAAAPPPGYKGLAQYVCLAQPFSGIPPGKGVTISVCEADSSEAIAAALYPSMLAGADINTVPVIDMPIGGMTDVEKKARG